MSQITDPLYRSHHPLFAAVRRLTTIGRIGAALLVAVTAFATLPGCRVHDDAHMAVVCLIDAADGSTGLKVAVKSHKLPPVAVDADHPAFVDIPKGTYAAIVTVEYGKGRSETLAPVTLDAKMRGRYTVVVLGRREGVPTVRLCVFDDTPIAAGSAKKTTTAESKPANAAIVRVVNTCTDTDSVDVTAGAVDVFQGVRFARRSSKLPFTPAAYQWRVIESGAAFRPICAPSQFTVAAGHRYLLVVSGRRANHSVKIGFVEED